MVSTTIVINPTGKRESTVIPGLISNLVQRSELGIPHEVLYKNVHACLKD